MRSDQQTYAKISDSNISKLRRKESSISVETLHRYFTYADGKIYWRLPPSPKVRAGDEAKSKCTSGYLRVWLLGKMFRVHRVVFAMNRGRWPVGYLDHCDGDKTNNRIENLRECTSQQNNRNRTAGRRSSSGRVGVSWNKQTSKWTASIVVNGSRTHLGRFADLQSAISARVRAEMQLFGEFSTSHRKSQRQQAERLERSAEAQNG